MIYIDDHLDLLDIPAALAAVDNVRREYTLRYRRPIDQRQSLSAFLLLRRALLEEYGMDSVPDISFGAHGKPFFKDYPHIHFNLSHCQAATACIVAEHPVGIDVECLERHCTDELIQKTMNTDEQQYIAASPCPDAAFARLWTMKESLLKLTGKGLSGNLSDVLAQREPYRFQTIQHAKYICTACEYQTPPTAHHVPIDTD